MAWHGAIIAAGTGGHVRALGSAMLLVGFLLLLAGGFGMGWELAGFWLGLALGLLFFGVALVPVVVLLDRWGLL